MNTLKMIPLLFLILTGCEQNNSKKLSEKQPNQIHLADTISRKIPRTNKDPFTNPEQYDPITFIHAVSKYADQENSNSIPCITMNDNFPIDWVKREHIDTLITMLNSKDSCCCVLNPLSSYIPNEFAEKGAYAAIFIKSYKNKQAVSFGLYSCPRVDENLNQELIDWWNKNKDE